MEVRVQMDSEADPLRLHGQTEVQIVRRVSTGILSSGGGLACRKRVVEDERS